MKIWSEEIKELERLYEYHKDQLPELNKELKALIITEDENVALLYSRRCLEVIITDLCECELKRPRKTEPLKGIIDKLNKEEKVPSHIITSMHSLNSLSSYGAHPKEFDPHQVKPVLNNLKIIIEWHIKHKSAGGSKTAEKKVLYPDLIEGGKKYSILGSLSKSEKSIIVLPFENLSPDPDQEYFSDGLTEEIITDLSQMHDLHVISRSSAMTFKGARKKIKEIAEEVNVRFVLEGSVRKAGNDLRITAQLIDAMNDTHLWAEKYTGRLDDVFNIQEKVSRSIADALKIKLYPEEKKPTANLRAYDLYLLGRYYWNKRTEEGLHLSIGSFQKAIELDEGYTLAYAGLSDAYYVSAEWNYLPPEGAYQKALELAQKALLLDNNIAEVYATLGGIADNFEFNYEKAELLYQTALGLNPNYATAHQWYADFLTRLGRFDEAITFIYQALKLDPLSAMKNYTCGFIYYYAEAYDNALLQFKETLKIDPGFPLVRFLMFLCYFQKGLMNEAIEEYQKVLVYDSSLETYKIKAKEIYNKNGTNGFLEFIIDLELQNPDPSRRYLAIFYSLLGDKHKALEYIEYNVSMYISESEYIKVEPAYANLRSEPRFVAILKKLGLTEFPTKEKISQSNKD